MLGHKKELQVYIYLLFFSIVVLFIIKYSGLKVSSLNESLVKGKIDASCFNFQNSVLKLDGEWEIYFDQYLYAGDFTDHKGAAYLNLDSWNKMGFENTGHATYRAVVKKMSEITEFGLKISNVYSSYEVFVDGEQIKGLSAPVDEGVNKEDIKITNDYHYFLSEGDSIEIVIHVQNSDHYTGGLTSAPILGTPKNIQQLKDLNLALSVFLIACLTCMSIFIFSFYMAKDEENCIIYLGLASISYVIKVFLSASGPLYFLYHVIPYYFLNKLLLISTMLTTFFIFDYFNNSFKRDKNCIPKMLKIILIAYMVLILFAKAEWFYYLNTIMIILTVVTYKCAFVLAIIDLFQHQQKAVFNFSGAVILIISFSLDIDNLDISKYRIIGLFVFCALALVNIINDYISTYKNLHQIKNSLELEVENRTLELVTIHNNLEREVQARILAEENLKSIPNYDISTGLFNTMYASNHLDAQISAFYRHNQIFSIIIYEINDLKTIGQTFSRGFAERVVLESSEVIRQLLRKTDILARWKSDRFIIIMANCSEHSAVSVAEKVKISIAQNIIEGIGSVTISLGVATVRENDNTTLIIRRAEKNLDASQINKF